MEKIKSDSEQLTEIPPDFVPWGAFAFLVALALLCAALWFGIYFMMIGKS